MAGKCRVVYFAWSFVAPVPTITTGGAKKAVGQKGRTMEKQRLGRARLSLSLGVKVDWKESDAQQEAVIVVV